MENMETILAIYSVMVGLIMGSFLNVCIYRIPLKKTLGGRSACPNCSKKVAWYDNVPVLSYLFLKGACRQCHQKISLRYPLVEILTGVLSYFTFCKTGAVISFFVWFVLFVCPLIAITFIDFDHQIIPDVISLPGILVGVGVSVYAGYPEVVSSLIQSGLGILVGGGSLFLIGTLYMFIRKREGMGGGDVKLCAMLGAFLGYKAIIFIFFMGSVLGLVYAIVSMIFTRSKEGPMIIPFGPFLSAAALLFFYAGDEIITAYLRFSGLMR